jgi:hypothetical protein
VIALWGSWFFS